MFSYCQCREQWHPQIPRPRNSSVPSSRSSQSRRLCSKTLLVSGRLGGGAATGDLVTDHQEDERERPSNQSLRLRAYGPAPPSQSMRYIRKTHLKGSAHSGQLGDGLDLSPQRLRGDKTIEIKRLFPREQVVHSTPQFMREHRQGFGFAVLVFEFGKVRFAWLTLAEEEDHRFGKGPA